MTRPRFDYPPAYREIDPAVRREIISMHALDGYPINALLHLPPGDAEPDTVVFAMHPRGDFSRHYTAPGLVAAGYAVCGATGRYLNNDADALHERLLLDVGAVIERLRERFRRVVLLGNSGGGSLFAFYLQQQGLAPEARLTHAPSGDRVSLGDYELPAADGLILLAAHMGEGQYMLERLDPAVVDEADPAAVDPDLDMYDPKNGYRPMREGPSEYTAEFLERFRAAQRARCARLDARCRAWCEEARYWRKQLRDPSLDQAARTNAQRRGLPRRYMVIYRTLADPRYLDLRLDPNRRPIGSLFAMGGRDPIAANYGEGLSRVMSARGWLSTWSGLESRAALPLTLPDVKLPALVVYADADTEIYERECREQHALVGSEDKTFATLPYADHYFYTAKVPGAEELRPGRERLVDEVLLPWIRERFPL